MRWLKQKSGMGIGENGGDGEARQGSHARPSTSAGGRMLGELQELPRAHRISKETTIRNLDPGFTSQIPMMGQSAREFVQRRKVSCVSCATAAERSGTARLRRRTPPRVFMHAPCWVSSWTDGPAGYPLSRGWESHSLNSPSAETSP